MQFPQPLIIALYLLRLKPSPEHLLIINSLLNIGIQLLSGSNLMSEEVIALQRLVDRNPIRNVYSFDSTPALLNGDLIAES